MTLSKAAKENTDYDISYRARTNWMFINQMYPGLQLSLELVLVCQYYGIGCQAVVSLSLLQKVWKPCVSYTYSSFEGKASIFFKRLFGAKAVHIFFSFYKKGQTFTI